MSTFMCEFLCWRWVYWYWMWSRMFNRVQRMHRMFELYINLHGWMFYKLLWRMFRMFRHVLRMSRWMLWGMRSV